MDESIISFIIYTENEAELFKCKSFINNLILPKGFTKEIIEIDDAFCITNAYNIGMNLSKGKYKVYVKENIYITNPNFINEILKIFQNPEVGIIGLIGSKYSNNELDWRKSTSIYGSIFNITSNDLTIRKYKNPPYLYEDVTFLSSSLLATQYDITWLEDIFDGNHLYNYSHCFEFLRQKRKVVVPKQSFPWAIHYAKSINMDYYDFYKQLFLDEYRLDIEKYFDK